MLLDLLEDLNDLVQVGGVEALYEDLLEFGLDEDDADLLEDEVLLSLLIEHAESLGEEELLEGIFSALKKAAGRVKKAAGRVAGDYRAAKKAVDHRASKRGVAKTRLKRMQTKQYHAKEKKKAYGRAWQTKGARSTRRGAQLKQGAATVRANSRMRRGPIAHGGPRTWGRMGASSAGVQKADGRLRRVRGGSASPATPSFGRGKSG